MSKKNTKEQIKVIRLSNYDESKLLKTPGLYYYVDMKTGVTTLFDYRKSKVEHNFDSIDALEKYLKKEFK